MVKLPQKEIIEVSISQTLALNPEIIGLLKKLNITKDDLVIGNYVLNYCCDNLKKDSNPGETINDLLPQGYKAAASKFKIKLEEAKKSYIRLLEFGKKSKPKNLIRAARLKKSEMEKDYNYLFCPDPSCNFYWIVHHTNVCESYCPRVDDLVKIIQCHNCGEPIELPGNHFRIRRVDHECPDGRHASNFQRMSGNYRILYERPK